MPVYNNSDHAIVEVIETLLHRYATRTLGQESSVELRPTDHELLTGIISFERRQRTDHLLPYCYSERPRGERFVALRPSRPAL